MAEIKCYALILDSFEMMSNFDIDFKEFNGMLGIHPMGERTAVLFKTEDDRDRAYSFLRTSFITIEKEKRIAYVDEAYLHNTPEPDPIIEKAVERMAQKKVEKEIEEYNAAIRNSKKVEEKLRDVIKMNKSLSDVADAYKRNAEENIRLKDKQIIALTKECKALEARMRQMEKQFAANA